MKDLKTPLKVLFISAEVAPFSSVGGLSQVSYFLPRALINKGIDIRIFTPKYGSISEPVQPLKMVVEGLKIPTGEQPGGNNPTELICNVKEHAGRDKKEPTVYFLENMEYYEKRSNVYNYSDDYIRFGLLSRGALEFIRTGEFVPDIIHANDWHAAYALNNLKHAYKDDQAFQKISSLLSIHNTYQGLFNYAAASDLDFDDGKGPLAPFYSDRFYKQNALKRGIINADLINTVSETYAHELITEEYGAGLSNLFRELRGKLFGVLNGLDYEEFNPYADRLIKRNYNIRTFNNRKENKTDLQKEFSLELRSEVPLLAFYGRLDRQKGIDLIMETIEFLLSEFNIQFVIVGQTDPEYRQFFQNLEAKYPGRVGTHLMFNAALPRKIIAGADMLLMPSRYEPGGIVAIEAMRYGCIPIVRGTGGLLDIVKNFDVDHQDGNGFSFKKYSSLSFVTALVRALEAYKNPDLWKKIITNAMKADFSWDKSAEKYIDLYHRAVDFHKEILSENPSLPFKTLSFIQR